MRLSFLLLTVFLSGCASMGAAHMIKETKDGGRVRLSGTNSVWEEGSQKRANEMMKAKCPQGFEITETGLTERASRSVALSGTYRLEEKYIDFKCSTTVGAK